MSRLNILKTKLSEKKIPKGSRNLKKVGIRKKGIHTDNSGEILVHYVDLPLSKVANNAVLEQLEGNNFMQDYYNNLNSKNVKLKINKLDDFDLYCKEVKRVPSKKRKIPVKKTLEDKLKDTAETLAAGTGRPAFVEAVPTRNHSNYLLAVGNGYFRNHPFFKDIGTEVFNLGSSEYYALEIDPITRALVIPTVRNVNGFEYDDYGKDKIYSVPNNSIKAIQSDKKSEDKWIPVDQDKIFSKSEKNKD